MSEESRAPRVSVIIPICNVEKFLDECLDSVQGQTLQNIEIICLNDGSTDGSSAIMHAHSEADARIVCIDKENEGYGATCNRGLEMARGEYVAIVEPDDYLLPDMFEEMLRLGDELGGGIDVIKTPWYDLIEWDKPETLKVRQNMLSAYLRTSKAPFVLKDAPILLEGHPSIWSALYRRDFLNGEGIRFHPYPGAGWADNPFLIDSLCKAKSIAYLNKPFYCYRIDLPGSTKNHATDEKVALPFDRWIEMTGMMNQMGVTDKGIWQAHTVRAFNYVRGAIADDGWDNPVVQAKTREVFELIPEEYIINCAQATLPEKRRYFEVLGKPVPKLSPVPRAQYLFGRAIRILRSQGFSTVAERTASFASRKLKHQGAGEGRE